VIVNKTIPEDVSKDFKIAFSFFGPKGSPFGSPFYVKLHIKDIQSEAEMYKKAIELMKTSGMAFEKCVESAKNNRD